MDVDAYKASPDHRSVYVHRVKEFTIQGRPAFPVKDGTLSHSDPAENSRVAAEAQRPLGEHQSALERIPQDVVFDGDESAEEAGDRTRAGGVPMQAANGPVGESLVLPD